MIIFECLFLFLLSLFIRLYPVRNNRTDFDTYGHLYFVAEIKKQKSGIWDGIEPSKSWKYEKWHHPFLWHWLVSFLPTKMVLRNQKWLNGILDSIFSTFVFLILIQLGYNENEAWIGSFLYLFTPMWFSSISMGPRVNSFTPRLFSEICLNLFFLLVLLELGISKISVLVLTTMLAFFLISSTKFGLQALFFITPILCLFIGSVAPLVPVTAGLLLAFIFSRGKIAPMLKRQLVHLSEYYQRNKDDSTAVSKRNKISKIFYNPDKSKASLKTIILRLVSENSYTAVFFKMPIYIVTLFLILYGNISEGINLNLNSIAPILSSTIIYMLVNIPVFLFLGEAERYISHISIFIIITCLSLAIQLKVIWLLWLLVVYGILFWLIELVLVGNIASQVNRESADNKIEKYLINLKTRKLVLSFPYHNFCVFRVMLNTQHNAILPVYIMRSIRSKFVKDFEYCYPYLNLEKLDKIKNETGCDLLIIDKRALVSEGLANWVPSEQWKKVDLAQSVYDVYERPV